MHGGQEGYADPAEQRKRQPVDVCVNHVEVFRALGDGLQQHGTGRIGVHALLTEAQCAWPHGMEFAFRPGIAAREQRDVVTELHQFVHQPRHHPLGAAVQLRANAFGEGRELSIDSDPLDRKHRSDDQHDGSRNEAGDDQQRPLRPRGAYHQRPDEPLDQPQHSSLGRPFK